MSTFEKARQELLRRLRDAIEQSPMSEFEIAAAAGVAPKTIYNVRRGKHEPGAATLTKLETALLKTEGDV